MGSVRGLNYVLPRPAPRRRPSPARRPLRSLHINSSHRGKSLRSRAIIFIPYCTEREQQQGAGASEAARVGARRGNEVSLQSVVSHYHTHSYQTEHTVPSPVDELRGWGPTVGRRPAGWCTPRMHTTSAVRVQRYPLVLAAIPCCRRSPRVSPPPLRLHMQPQSCMCCASPCPVSTSWRLRSCVHGLRMRTGHARLVRRRRLGLELGL